MATSMSSADLVQRNGVGSAFWASSHPASTLEIAIVASNPYVGRPPRSFWRSGVARQKPETIEDLYRRKFEIKPTDRVATAGSCFAQHIARRLRQHGYTVLDTEPAPRGMDRETQARFGYGLYSARYGNIYTTRQLLQLLQEALGKWTPSNIIWEKSGRYFDALRPNVEPEGLDSPDDVLALRKDHLSRVKKIVRGTDIFVFTFGLTEAWVHKASGTVYPTAPGTIAGDFSPDEFEFRNFTYEEILSDFMNARKILRRHNPNIRFIVTVSPVPLAATATDQHVLPATILSKSILRAVAGALEQRCEDVDYFPSYEVIASSFSEGRFYEADKRNVTDDGVDSVMRIFFGQHPPAAPESRPVKPRSREWVVCEEAMLEAFGT